MIKYIFTFFTYTCNHSKGMEKKYKIWKLYNSKYWTFFYYIVLIKIWMEINSCIDFIIGYCSSDGFVPKWSHIIKIRINVWHFFQLNIIISNESCTRCLHYTTIIIEFTVRTKIRRSIVNHWRLAPATYATAVDDIVSIFTLCSLSHLMRL